MTTLTEALHGGEELEVLRAARDIPPMPTCLRCYLILGAGRDGVLIATTEADDVEVVEALDRGVAYSAGMVRRLGLGIELGCSGPEHEAPC